MSTEQNIDKMQRKVTIAIILTGSFLILSIGILTFSLIKYAKAPTKYMSNETQQCSKVEYPNGRVISCNDFVDEIHHIKWVK